ncbi:4Fe-4S dicluster domain-containing protein [Anoxybacterium hadale]|uniref:4Fe-4S dicluster domain-containing protein n=1 Tax=Anoxybacterium hadale TaxID=3408580 RepID=A0ACD1AFG0_9FIRM|nr:4Fe-4S dicluster domain-containing protein [Clostridiales bacterium]
MIDQIGTSFCTGCKMCGDLCPCEAISFATDKRGFWYPVVDPETCIGCGVCIEACPESGKCLFHRDLGGSLRCQWSMNPPTVYAAWVKDNLLRLRSTSGGLFSALAGDCLARGGAVAACRYTEDWKGAFHWVCQTQEELEMLIGSKYFQSDTGGIFREIKSLLDRDVEVLFCGTPCQSAALQSFLGTFYDKLTTVDFVCRGINSPEVYRRYLSELEEKYQSPVKSVHMKNKRLGWESLGFSVRFQNGKEYFRQGKDDAWVRGYLKKSLFTRPSCFSCKYKSLNRISDITIGDFWGIGSVQKEDLFQGISLVIVNSRRGELQFERIKDGIVWERRSLEEAAEGNSSLLMNDLDDEGGKQFYELLETMKVSQAVDVCLKLRFPYLTKKLPSLRTRLPLSQPVQLVRTFCQTVRRKL